MRVEHVIRRQTRQTAESYGLADRWLLAPGMLADITVIDDDNLTFGKPHMGWELPCGAPRLTRKASGYRHTFGGGVETVTDDEFTGELPRRPVCGPQGTANS